MTRGAVVDGSVQVAGGRITAIGNDVPDDGSAVVDLAGSTLRPGFVDIHNHGAVGVDVNTSSAEDLVRVAAFLAENGVVAWLPTLVPDEDENYVRGIEAIDGLMELQEGQPIAQALGVHYEGPFVNAAMCGALRSKYFKTGARNQHELTRTKPTVLHRLKSGVHMTTLAPEIDGGIELIKQLVSDGWIVAIGHSNASLDVLDRAFDAGARHLTHFFNAMSGIHHREMGVAGWGLTKQGVTFDIIADGHHVHPSMLKLACYTKGTEHVSLISDSVAPTGLGDGKYELWDETISIREGRTIGHSGKLAGSVITMADAVRQMRNIGFGDDEIAAMASMNPARLLGMDNDRGSIEVGKRADLVTIDDSGNVVFSMVGGRVVVNKNKG